MPNDRQHRLLTCLTHAKLAIEMVERCSALSAQDQRLLELALQAVNQLTTEVLNEEGPSLAEPLGVKPDALMEPLDE